MIKKKTKKTPPLRMNAVVHIFLKTSSLLNAAAALARTAPAGPRRQGQGPREGQEGARRRGQEGGAGGQAEAARGEEGAAGGGEGARRGHQEGRA